MRTKKDDFLVVIEDSSDLPMVISSWYVVVVEAVRVEHSPIATIPRCVPARVAFVLEVAAFGVILAVPEGILEAWRSVVTYPYPNSKDTNVNVVTYRLSQP